MEGEPTDAIGTFQDATDRISWIAGYETEAEVEAAGRQIAEYFGLPSFVFGAFFRTGERENYRYLVGCVPEWCYLYNDNKWYAIDPFIDYALKNANPVLASDIVLRSAGQQRMMALAAEYGFRSGVVAPAHSVSALRVGILYLGTSEGPESARESLVRHRHLMRAFALELLVSVPRTRIDRGGGRAALAPSRGADFRISELVAPAQPVMPVGDRFVDG